jgi:hypothetical protein
MVSNSLSADPVLLMTGAPGHSVFNKENPTKSNDERDRASWAWPGVRLGNRYPKMEVHD